MDVAGPAKRRPGDGNDFDARRNDPNADFLGTQFGEGGDAGWDISIYRWIRFLVVRRRDRRGGRHGERRDL